jgi:hypothetical protein
MAGEAAAHVQSLGLKAVAAVYGRLTNSPVTRGIPLVTTSSIIGSFEMKDLLFLIGFLSLVAIPVGSLMLLFKKQRKRGLKTLAGAVLAFVVYAVGLSQYKDKNAEVASKGPEKQRFDLQDFPDAETHSAAHVMGLKTYKAYSQRADENAVRKYCAWVDQSFDLSKQREIEFEANNSESYREKIYEKFELLQTELLSKTSSSLGIKNWEFIQLANTAYWDFHCRAYEKGWSVITSEQALAANRSDAKEASNSLTAFYLQNLNDGTSYFFDPSRYSAAHCHWENFGEMRFVGCQLRSFSGSSGWDVFLVARSNDGKLLIAPVSGKARQHLTRSGKSEKMDSVARNRTYVEAYGEPRSYLSDYAGLIDTGELQAVFDN